MVCFTNLNRFTDLNRFLKMSSLERCLVSEDLCTREYNSTSMFCVSSMGTYNATPTYTLHQHIHYTRVEYGLDDPDNPDHLYCFLNSQASLIWKLAS